MKKIMALLAIALMFTSKPAFAVGCTTSPANQPASTFPSLNGRLLYHSYVTDGDGSSQLFMLDFATSKLTQLSNANWQITDPMNAMFSVDGNWIIFMGVKNNAWNLFIYRIGSTSLPINLTNSTGLTKNEDPKFSTDGTQIFFKQTSWPMGIAHYSILSAPLVWTNGIPKLGTAQTLISPSSITEYSMPFASPDASILYYSTGSGNNSAVWSKPIVPIGSATQIDGSSGNPAFYPIVRNDGAALYTKWITNQSYQILLRPFGSVSSIVAPFNDCKGDNEDAAPVNGTNYVIFSSTTAGGYQLYLGDAASGKRWSLTPYGVNADTSKGKFGASYR